MGFYVRYRVPVTKSTRINVSKTGASVSQRVGKRVTVNSRGRVTVRLARGLFYRIGR